MLRSVQEALAGWITEHGYGGLFTLLVFGIVGIPIPDEFLLTFAGFLVFKQRLSLVPTIASAVAGSCCGITLSYGIGRAGGHRFVRRFGRYVHLTEERLDKVHAWFDRRGHWALTFGYFFAGVRHLTAIVAGSSNLALGQFALFAYGGALMWATGFILLGYFVGDQWSTASEEAHHIAEIITLVAIGVVLIYVGVRWLKKKRASLSPPPPGPS
jgi:membrane protein DedA with SNARE-associated domain